MKKLMTILAIASVSAAVHSQFNTPWTTNTSNSLQNGYIGIGTNPSTNTTVLPNFNFQVHGVVDYIGLDGPLIEPQLPSGMTQNDKEINTQNYLKSTKNFGKASRIGLTNSVTGLTKNDGGLIMMAQEHLYFRNMEF